MKTHFLNREQLVKEAEFSASDVEKIKQCRHDYTQLGFGYQLACVRVLNRFPAQKPLEIIDEILTFVSLQLGMLTSSISQVGTNPKGSRQNRRQESQSVKG